jgi:hypothetical protein
VWTGPHYQSRPFENFPWISVILREFPSSCSCTGDGDEDVERRAGGQYQGGTVTDDKGKLSGQGR